MDRIIHDDPKASVKNILRNEDVDFRIVMTRMRYDHALCFKSIYISSLGI
jgi:hypothetical protein